MKKPMVIPASNLDRLANLLEAFTRPVLASIAGGSCSGKSFIARRIAYSAVQRGMSAVTLPLDMYFRDADDSLLPRDSLGRNLFDVPQAYHADAYLRHAVQLLAGKPMWIPAYDTRTNTRVTERGTLVEPAELLIADGLFAIEFLARLHPQMLAVYVEASEYVRVSRRIMRDTRTYGVTEEAVRNVFRKKVLPCHARYVEPQKLLADIIVLNDEELRDDR